MRLARMSENKKVENTSCGSTGSPSLESSRAKSRDENERMRQNKAHFRTLAFSHFLILSLFAISTVKAESIFQQTHVTDAEVKNPEAAHKRGEALAQSPGLGPIQISEKFGRVVDTYEGKTDKTIVHIQDAHVHYEAQKNLAAILDSLIRNNHMTLVLVEGGDKRGELSSLRKLASREAREAVADRYLKKGLLAGDEYLELVSDYPMVRQGVEDPALYEENLKLFLEIETFRKKALEDIAALEQATEALKQKLCKPALLEFEKKRAAYDTEQIELVAYYDYLASLKTPPQDSNFSRLLQASALEKEVDFKKVDAERDALLKAIDGKLSAEDKDSFAAKTLSYQEGTLSQKEYYETLKVTAEKGGVVLTESPNLEKYIRYLAFYDSIRHAELFKEGDRLEQEIREGLLGSEDEKLLSEISQHLSLLSHLFQIRVSPEEYARYDADRIRFSVKTFLPFLQQKIAEQGLAFPVPPTAVDIDQDLKTLDRFYRVAQRRDQAFVENSFKEMEKENVKSAVLITGGFHTPGLTQLFKEKGISYIVISPKITEAGNPEKYYSILKERSGLARK